MNFFRVFIEKKQGFQNEALELLEDIRETLHLPTIQSIRLFNIYEMNGVDIESFETITRQVFSEINTDNIYHEIPVHQGTSISWEAVPGQFDQRSDSAAQCIHLIYPSWQGQLKSGRLLQINGELSHEQLISLENYIINPLESRTKDLNKKSLELLSAEITPLKSFVGFNSWDRDSLDTYRKQDGLAMTLADLEHVQRYFRDQEKRDPRETELKVLDTYWSDHCRHTTFETKIESLEIEHGPWKESIHNAWLEYQQVREDLNRQKKPSTLMDLATLAAKEMRSKGELDDLEISEEINACSVKIDVTVDDKKEPWLLMFKNETHNHPTEIEPFGGASTCIGGAIRDPLSGRSYVYQAMRVTGSGDPRAELEDTIPGKLPQKVITRGAARGYSSYGNQIGLATSLVKEIYHPGYQAKRMEVGAVVGAVPQDWVRRISPVPGDIVLLLGGKTGRDGCGGATGSSKAHTEDSLMSCGAEVQKGNAPEERKIQRLFRNPELTKLIKKCNDFGAGGVSVAIGELSDGLTIDLDQVPVKYLGLNGTELAISESQERMAVVVEPQHVSNFILLAKKENLECLKVAEVTGENRLTMTWKGQTLVDLDRTFLDTNGVRSSIDVKILSPQENENPFLRNISGKDRSEQFINNLKELNVASQKGLGEMFDASIGKGTVFMPYGGKNQLSESEASAHKLPVLHGETQTCSIMGHGYNPEISSWSPYHGSLYAVVESITRLAAMGGDWQKSRLSFQEYFQRMTSKEIWGQPLAALLGALQIQRQWKAPAIGGKDSMSGSFGDIHVPPTLISFAVCTGEADKLTSSEFQQDGSYLYLLRHTPKEDLTPDSAQLQDNFNYLDQLRSKGNVLSAMSIKEGGVAEVLFKAAVGNGLGVEANLEDWAFNREFGSILFESSKKLEDSRLIFIGRTNGSGTFIINGKSLTRKNALKNWKEPLAKVFHDLKDQKEELLEQIIQEHNAPHYSGQKKNPKVLLPVFPGTNCEYDTARTFEKAGALSNILVFKNQNSQDVKESIESMKLALQQSQILMLSGGFSSGDEPDGSGKFIANVLQNEIIHAEIQALLDRDGLILGICNGFQALVKSGLLPNGEIGSLQADDPTLTHNEINRHISRMVSTRVASTLSPWTSLMKPGDIHKIAISHGEGRFYANQQWVQKLKENGQICFQYADEQGRATMDSPCNPNGSIEAIEGICSPDGRILGKMGHSERYDKNLFRNIPGEKHQPLFEGGIGYFR